MRSAALWPIVYNENMNGVESVQKEPLIWFKRESRYV